MNKQKKQKRSGCGHSKPKQINIKHGMNALDRIQTKERIMYDQRTDKQIDFLLQIGCDAFILSNADLYDMQPGRALEAVNTYRTYINELAAHLIDDADADEEMVYFWTDLDRRLQQICGPKFATHDKRYDETGRNVFSGIYDAYIERLKAVERMRTDSVKEMIAEMAVEAEQAGQDADESHSGCTRQSRCRRFHRWHCCR